MKKKVLSSDFKGTMFEILLILSTADYTEFHYDHMTLF